LDDIQLKLNDILKVEGGVLRPLDSSNKQQPQQAEASTTGSTMTSNHDGFQLRNNDPFARAVLVQTWPESRKQRGISQLHHHHQHSYPKVTALLHQCPSSSGDVRVQQLGDGFVGQSPQSPPVRIEHDPLQLFVGRQSLWIDRE
jgi:hypothetical protein